MLLFILSDPNNTGSNLRQRSPNSTTTNNKNTSNTKVRTITQVWKKNEKLIQTWEKFWAKNCIIWLNPIPPRLFPNLFPLGGGRHVSHPVELHTKIFLHQNFSLSGLRVSIADFGFEGPGFDSLLNHHFH